MQYKENIHKKPLILIIDDITRNLQLLGTILINEGFEVSLAENGTKALLNISTSKPDLILLDIMSSEINSYDICRRIVNNPESHDIPIIFLTSTTDSENIIKAYESGGVDYITKPFKKEELLSRIKIHIELRKSKVIIQDKVKEIEEINRQLVSSNKDREHYLGVIHSELDLAANYVRSMLPEALISPPIKTDWLFIPSARLGGDSFGYHWLDENNFIFYLLDVCGHGIGSTLMSMSAINTIKFQTLSVDFKDPGQVFSSLNHAFDMVKHNDLYFSIWYGIFNKKTRELTFSSAGHPPALLINKENDIEELQTRNLFIGTIPKRSFNTATYHIPENSSILLYSDGVYEFKTKENKVWGLRSFIEHYKNLQSKSDYKLTQYYEYAKSMTKSGVFDDDFSMLKIEFM